MPYGKILVDEVENSSGDTFDLSHGSLTGTSETGSHPASAISTDSGLSVQEKLDEASETVSSIISPWADTSDLAHEPSFDNFAKTDDMFIESYGQSLAIGSHGSPVISTTQNYNNVMFTSGVKRISGTDYSEFVDLVETLTGQYGETPVTSITNYLSESDDDYTSDGTRYIGSASGAGGQPIYNLNRGSTIYTYLMDRIQAAKDLSDADGRSFSVPVIFWTQGEADYNGDTDYRSYIESLTNLHSDLLEDVTSVTGQDYLPYMVTYQMGSHRAYGENTPTIALAIKEVCDKTEGFGIACPLYSFEHYTDNIHLTNDSYYSLGQYYGKAAKDLMDYGQVQNCHIKSAVCNGYTIMVDVNVPVPPLVIDTDNVAEAIGYGFYIKSISQGLDASNNLINMVTEVEVVNDTQLKITVDEDVPSDARLVYAHGRPADDSTSGPTTGPRGNIRDSQGDDWNWTTPTNGTYRRGDNWLLVDDVVIEHVNPKDLFEDFDGDVIDLTASVHTETPSLSVPFNESGRLDYGIGTEYVSGLPVYGVDFTRSTASTVINRSGVLETLAADEIGIGADGVWFHDEYTNLALYSDDFSQSAWVKTNATATATTDTTDPMGGTGAYLCEVSSESGLIQQIVSATSGETYTMSGFFKKATSSQVYILTFGTLFDFDLGEVVSTAGNSTKVLKMSNGWFWVSVVFTITGSAIGIRPIIDDAGTTAPIDCYAYGLQLVEGSSALPYLSTSGSASSATATSCTVPVSGNLPATGNSCTWVVDTNAPETGEENRALLIVSGATTSGDFTGIILTSAGGLTVRSGSNGSGDVSFGSVADNSAYIDGGQNRFTFVYDADTETVTAYVNGNSNAAGSVDVSGMTFPSDGNIVIGSTSSSWYLNAQLKNFKLLHYAESANGVKSWGAPK